VDSSQSLTPPASSLSEVLDSLRLTRVSDTSFTGTQLDAPGNHILGGHIAAQALFAAGQTAPGRAPHSMHTYFLRPGDASRPVEFEVVHLQQGRTFSALRVTARQDGEVLMELMASFSAAHEQFEYQPPMPAIPEPESLPYVAPHFAETSEAGAGQWASMRWYERRIADIHSATSTLPPARTRIWWRPDGKVPDDALLASCLTAYLSAVTLTEPAHAARPIAGGSALRDHALWFHRPAVLTDWLLFDQSAPSSADGRCLAGGLMFNRGGDLVCTVKQELYFLPSRGDERAR
jgi:acyl-CoA thioesterase-2